MLKYPRFFNKNLTIKNLEHFKVSDGLVFLGSPFRWLPAKISYWMMWLQAKVVFKPEDTKNGAKIQNETQMRR